MRNHCMDLGPFSLRDKSARSGFGRPKDAQRVPGMDARHQKDRMRGEITCFNPLSPTLSLWEREGKAGALFDGLISIPDQASADIHWVARRSLSAMSLARFSSRMIFSKGTWPERVLMSLESRMWHLTLVSA